MVHEGIHRSHLALLPASADRRALYAWAASQSEEGDVFLVPPTWGEFRLVTRRAVVVDWKVVPFEAAEVAEWIARIDAITGGAGVPAGADRIDEAYMSLTCAQLQDVATRYGALYVVLPGERDPCGPVAYQDAAWSVWSVRRVDERASRAEP
ncbi:MAG: hypothetical protein HC882_04385 [Acidobacteria bacterium]|nr:hypothetical protein [Acidobacteriota bacterium]